MDTHRAVRGVRRGLAVSAVVAAGMPAVAGVGTAQAATRGSTSVVSAAGQVAHVRGAHTRELAVHAASGSGHVLQLTGRPRTSPFDLIGATWSANASHNGRIEVRVHRHGRWSGWHRLAAGEGGASASSPDAAADRRHDRIAATPVWVGSANGVDARVVSTDRAPASRPRGLHLVLVNGGHSASDTAAQPVRSRARSAGGPISEPVIYSRQAWGADEKLRDRNHGCGTPEYASTIKVGFVHHTDTPNGYSRGQVPAMIRSMYRYHVEANGWCDIGYNFLVDRFGRIWQGRYGGNNRPVIGAHTGGFNTDSFGVAMIGTFNSVSPDAAMRAGVARILGWRLASNYRNPVGKATLFAHRFSGSRYRAGHNVRFNVISGHRNADFTDCPGTLGYRALPSIRSATMADIGPGLVAPSVSGTTIRAGSGATVTINARALRTESWTLSVLDSTGSVVDTVTGNAEQGGRISAAWDGTVGGVTPLLAPAGKYGLILTPGTDGRTGISFTAPVTVTSPLTINGPATAGYNTTVTLSGAAPAGTPVTVTVTDEAAQVVTATKAGRWSATFVASEDRQWQASAVIDGVTYTTRTGSTAVAPAVVSPRPIGSTLKPGSQLFTLRGTALPSAGTVSVTAVRGLIGTATVGADGTWSVSVHTGTRTTLQVIDGRGVRSPSYTVIV